MANIIELEAERHFFYITRPKKKKRVLIYCTYCAAAGLRDFPNDDDEGSLERENLGA